MTPAAVLKAESLAAYARSSGAPLSEFAVALTLGEGYELLDYLASGAMGILRNHEMLKRDIADAKAEGDPWIVLANFQLLGLDIVKAEKLN